MDMSWFKWELVKFFCESLAILVALVFVWIEVRNKHTNMYIDIYRYRADQSLDMQAIELADELNIKESLAKDLLSLADGDIDLVLEYAHESYSLEPVKTHLIAHRLNEIDDRLSLVESWI